MAWGVMVGDVAQVRDFQESWISLDHAAAAADDDDDDDEEEGEEEDWALQVRIVVAARLRTVLLPPDLKW